MLHHTIAGVETNILKDSKQARQRPEQAWPAAASGGRRGETRLEADVGGGKGDALACSNSKLGRRQRACNRMVLYEKSR